MTVTEKIKIACRIPGGYARFKLGIKLHPTHERVLDTLFSAEGVRVSLVAANATGKTSSVISPAILYALEMKGSLVIVSSGVYRQITQQVIPNIKKHSGLYKDWEFTENAVSIGGIKRLIGFSGDNEGTIQGWHAGRDYPGQPLLVIFDEAAAITPPMYMGIERCHPTWMLVAGSPGSPTGDFYNINTDPIRSVSYKHFKLSGKECTVSKGYWIKDEELKKMEDTWGHDHPLVLSSVYGEFAVNVEDCILSLSSLNKCINNPPTYVPGRRCVGIDFGGGKAETCVYSSIGNKVTKELSYVGDPMDSIAKVVECLNRLKFEIGLVGGEVNADADGLGVVCISRLKALGWGVNSFHGGASSSDAEFKNVIAQAWIDGCRKIERCEVIIPDDEVLRMQLLSRKAKFNAVGKMQLESKQDMSKRGVVSPDRADALMMSMYGPVNSTGTWTSVQPYTFKDKTYGRFC